MCSSRKLKSWANLPTWRPYYPDTKVRQKHYKKTKLQINISLEYRNKNSKLNFNKLNPIIHTTIIYLDKGCLIQ